MKTKIIGSIQSLFISQKGIEDIIKKPFLTLDIKGIVEDKYYDKGVDRSILISSTLAYDLLEKHHISCTFGSLGENLLVTFNPYDLDRGRRFMIGETILEITQECTICNHLAKIDPKVPALLQNDRGVFAKVIQGGIINLNDSITITN